MDMGASVIARLKNKAKESGKPFQLHLQLFCQEEFLRRLAAIAGSIAEGFYGVPENLREECHKRLPEPLDKVLVAFEEYLERKA